MLNPNAEVPSVLAMINRDNLANLQNIGNLRGKDLIALCNSEATINKTCNSMDSFGRNIFHRLLKEEFGEIFSPFEDAKDRYIRRHTKKFLIIDPRNPGRLQPGQGLNTQFTQHGKTTDISYRKYAELEDLRELTDAIIENGMVTGIVGIGSHNRVFRAILENPYNIRVRLDAMAPESGKIISALCKDDLVIVVTTSLDIHVYDQSTKIWSVYHNGNLILVDYYSHALTTFVLVRDQDGQMDIRVPRRIGQAKTTYEFASIGGAIFENKREVVMGGTGFVTAKLLTRDGILKEFRDPLSTTNNPKPNYCTVEYNESLFDSRNYPGTPFQFDRSKIKFRRLFIPPKGWDDDDLEDFETVVWGILNDAGELWFGYSHLNTHKSMISWVKAAFPDVIIDFKLDWPDEEGHIHPVYTLERSGKCCYSKFKVSRDLTKIRTKESEYYMDVPGLMALHPYHILGDQGTTLYPSYLQVSNLY